MINRFYIFFIVTILLFSSCQKVIDVEVNDTEEKLVIEAIYNASDEQVTVKLTKSIDVFGPVEFPTVSGAIIEIAGPNGSTEILEEVQEGVYVLNNYSPIFNSDYKMIVNVEGESYESTTYLPEVVPLDSLTARFEEASLFGGEGYVIFMHFKDPPGSNFYRATRIVNGNELTRLSQQFIFDDTFSEGNVQAVPFFSSRYNIDDTITVNLKSYSEASYDYYIGLFEIVGDGGQSAAPANPPSNWSNNALGHFAAWGYDSKTIVVEED